MPIGIVIVSPAGGRRAHPGSACERAGAVGAPRCCRPRPVGDGPSCGVAAYTTAPRPVRAGAPAPP